MKTNSAILEKYLTDANTYIRQLISFLSIHSFSFEQKQLTLKVKEHSTNPTKFLSYFEVNFCDQKKILFTLKLIATPKILIRLALTDGEFCVPLENIGILESSLLEKVFSQFPILITQKV